MNTKKFYNKNGQLHLAKIYQKKEALLIFLAPTYSQIHKTMKLMGFSPRSSK